jgi:divalent metal cation (Fe/Co/Zn/Cd) transporter
LQYFAISWMSVEIIGAVIAAIFASSFALLAFGADSVVETISAVVVLRHLTLDSVGSKGRGDRTALLTSLLLAVLAPIIAIGSTYGYFVLGVRPESTFLGIAIVLGSTVIMPALWIEKKRMGEKTGCLPLTIDAVESATCFLMALALLAGLIAEFILKLSWIDYAATMAIVGFIAYEAKESFSEIREKQNQVGLDLSSTVS